MSKAIVPGGRCSCEVRIPSAPSPLAPASLDDFFSRHEQLVPEVSESKAQGDEVSLEQEY